MRTTRCAEPTFNSHGYTSDMRENTFTRTRNARACLCYAHAERKQKPCDLIRLILNKLRILTPKSGRMRYELFT